MSATPAFDRVGAGWFSPSHRGPTPAAAAALLAAGVLGAVGGIAPVWALAAAVVAFAVAVSAAYSERLPRAFLAALAALLLVYLVLGKGGAYLNVGGVFVGELVLAFGLLAAVASGVAPLAFRTPLAWLVVAFGICGALQTIPYVPVYGRDALRDAVVWGYGLFALLAAACLIRTGWVPRTVAEYGRYLAWFPFWVPPLWAIFTYGGAAAPKVPGTGGEVPLIFFKSGDPAFHLTGIAAFVMLGLHEYGRARKPTGLTRLLGPGEWVWWGAWLVAFAITAATSRASLLAMLIALSLVPLVRPATKLLRPAVVTGALVSLFFASNIRVEVRDGRYLSPQEMVANLRSFGGEDAPGNRDATREWRLQWWKDIVGYTVYGKYFWTGKGFGVNLADDDGYQVEDGPSPLRSPHSGHLSILARAGVPGFTLWVVMQAGFAVALARAYARMRRAGEDWWARVDLWLLAYWTAFQVNTGFEVALEGPHGGIWFWSLFGFGLAALDAQRRLPRALRRGTGRPEGAPWTA
ncbi:hypothetical protein tb265_25800 [Gemmatimonadetes bacterium T265]|nr:hypothetical protein tb265_25800 [Gemmatimonadetes bacterium T265]